MTSATTRLIFKFLLTLALAAAPAVQAASSAGPSGRIEAAVNTFLDILNNDGLSRQERNDRVREEALELFDERAMAQSVLSTNWRQASAQQQEEFQTLFAQLLENTYIDRLDAYTNQSVRVEGQEINGSRATVTTTVLTDTANVPVNYRLRELNGEWYVYDVEVENVSLVNSYRETYLSVVQRQGLDGLLQQMRAKIAELRNGRQA